MYLFFLLVSSRVLSVYEGFALIIFSFFYHFQTVLKVCVFQFCFALMALQVVIRVPLTFLLFFGSIDTVDS